MMEEISTISLEGMLPRVFASEGIPDSEVWHAHLVFRRGGRYLVEAASGGGKSSLCAYIYGSRNDYEGTLRFNDTDVRTLPVDVWQRLRRKNIAYLSQELSLFPELTAIENIELKNTLTHHVSPDRIESWLHRLGIESRRDYPVGKMSIGQQQRVGIIRALCQPFDFLLLDEPVSHLDERNNRIASEIIAEEADRQGAAVISTSVGNPLLLERSQSLHL